MLNFIYYIMFAFWVLNSQMTQGDFQQGMLVGAYKLHPNYCQELQEMYLELFVYIFGTLLAFQRY